MQDRGDSTPEGAEEPGSNKPGTDSGQVGSENSESDQPEKVYDFYHQHFGVALAAGSQDVRNAEAGGRAAYASRTEVADKIGAKSESWNALKSLIRYQTSTTAAPEKDDHSVSGDSFEAQWFSKSSDDLPAVIAAEVEAEPVEQEAVRLKWTPIVDNVPEILDEAGIELPQPAQQSYEDALAATARGEHSAAEGTKPIAKKAYSKPSPMGRRLIPKPQSSANKSYEDALAATARGEQPIQPVEQIKPVDSVELVETVGAQKSVLDDIDELLDSALEDPVARREEDDASDNEVAEARSKFGSMNAFARMQKRTKEQVESKEEQSITGDIPDQVQDEVQAGNWETKPAAEASGEDGATVMNQWCSTSTGESHPIIPSLDELNSIPTPTVLKDLPAQAKPFSPLTPKASAPQTDEKELAPDSVHANARSSWLKAASEYSTSVIKAVTEQMKILNKKPNKTTPESPEFHTAELPEPPEDNS